LDGVGSDVELIEGDVRDLDGVRGAMRGVSRVFHEAAIPSVFRSVQDPLSSHEVNATGTLNVLLAARDEGVQRVVYASSSSIYGDVSVLPVPETVAPNPISPYGASKLAGEKYLAAFHGSYGMATVSLRYFNVFGPRQDPGSEYAAVVPRFVTAALEGRAPTVFGTGEQSRDFTFVGDVVGANLLASEAPRDAWGQAFNVAYNDRHSLLDLISTIRSLVPGAHPEPVHEPARPGDILHSQANTTLAETVLGYRPKFTFEEGLSRTVEWFRDHHG
ncbi:MAG: NAD-dependent epimerase/dehydratase family protein, partial [Actinobacteria bacterium]|nr:NAD-dependent epimerase/dehydratase family protein [Actinomycetota bacterium]